MVHLTSGERIGLLASRASIVVPILRLGTFGGIVSGFPTFEAGNVTQIFLGGCCGVGMIPIPVSSIPIAIPMAIMVMSIATML